MIKINGKHVIMEIDMGAAVFIMCSKSYNSLFPKTALQKSTMKLQTYMAKEMPVLGQLTVNVTYGYYSGSHTLYVVKGSGPCLLGRDWLQYIRLDWEAVYMNKSHSKIDILI